MGDLETTRGLDLSQAEASWGFTGRNYLFAIGIDGYAHWPPLYCAVKDIEDFTKILLERYQFHEDYVVSLKNEQATQKNILIKLRELGKKISQKDNLVIYFSGHGHYDEDTKSGFWIPVNAHTDEDSEDEFLNTAVIVDRLRAIDSLHTFLIIDACFSGTLMIQLKSAPRAERYRSRRVLTSGRAEVVSDGPKGGNSPFARGIINSLTLNTDQHLRASQLIIDVKEYVEKEAQQTPLDAVLLNSDDQGGDFVFHLKVSEDEIWTRVLRENKKEGYKKFIGQYPESAHLKEAKEAHDWLEAEEKGTLQSLQQYIESYRSQGGVYVGRAIAMQRDIESETLWEKTLVWNTLSAYNQFIYSFPESGHVAEAEECIRQTGSEPEIKPKELDIPLEMDDQLQWSTLKGKGSYKAYLNFTRSFPESKFVNEATAAMTLMDNRAYNNLKIMETNEKLSLQEKIAACETYFRDFQGSQNLNWIRQLKNRLEIQKTTRGL